jgi:hypothetical protein
VTAHLERLPVPEGIQGRWCPLCHQTSRRFRRCGEARMRLDAECAHCGALERHRLLWLFFHRRTDLFDGGQKSFLHVGPEHCLKEPLKQALGNGYSPAHLETSITAGGKDLSLPTADRSFDAVCCGDVLEQVHDDQRALNEFHRVLKDDGWLTLMVPTTVHESFEDPSLVDPYERLMAFGHKDRVRRYGT